MGPYIKYSSNTWKKQRILRLLAERSEMMRYFLFLFLLWQASGEVMLTRLPYILNMTLKGVFMFSLSRSLATPTLQLKILSPVALGGEGSGWSPL